MRSYAKEDGWIPLLVTILVLALVFGGLYYVYGNQKQVVSVDSGKCTCDDLSDLRNRLKEADAAIAEYKLAIKDVEKYQEESGKVVGYNEDTFREEQANVQKVIDAAYSTGAHSGTGDTGTDCGTTVNARTDCLRGSLQAHENVHASTCQRIKGQNQLAWNANYKDKMTMIEYWNEKIAAYTAEYAYLNAEIGRAKADGSCSEYECKKGSGVFYETAGKCQANCVRKIATMDNWCWEINPKNNTYTGKKY